MKTLKEKWRAFLNIVLGPGSVLFIIFTFLSLFLAYYFKENILFSTLLSVSGAIAAGFVGNFLKDDYEKLIGRNILEKKGRSALRNLQTINTQVFNIRGWIIRPPNKGGQRERVLSLEEVDRHLATIQLNISSGLSDWVDIVPELKENIEQEAELDKKYKAVVQSYVMELLERKKELITLKDTQAEIELKKKINIIEKQIKDIQGERSKFSGGIITNSGINFMGTGKILSADGGISLGVSPSFNRCFRCGSELIQDRSGGVALSDSTFCEECKKHINN